jgi:phosphomannomutase / phosphoglucomutase
MSIYKKCDIRGVFGSELRVEHAARLGTALSHLLPPQSPILVGGDGRISTAILKQSLINSLVTEHLHVIDLGLISTPTFYFARRKLNIQAGVMVTASHNPAEDNGFKITLGDLPITPGDMERIGALMETRIPAAKGAPGRVEVYDILPEYLGELIGLAPCLAGLKVVADCSNGMASQAARSVWQETGAEVTFLLSDIDGHFPVHAPNPANNDNLRYLGDAVLKAGADLGVCYDGDGDRVAFMNELGQPIPNDKVIVVFARDALSHGSSPIVYDQKCSRIVPDAILGAGGTPVIEQSGHTFIKTAFLRHKAPYAGEVTGHHFFNTIQGDDGIVASLFIGRLLACSGKKASSWMAAIPEYPITPDIRIPIEPGRVQPIMKAVEDRLGSTARVDHLDGLRLEFLKGWCLIRRSVTEPVLTVRIEGVTQTALNEIIGLVSAAAPELSRFLVGYQKPPEELNHDRA